MIWDIISMSVGSLVWGVLITVACMSLFVFIIRGWWKDALFTVWSYVIGCILFLLLSIQCTLIVGSLKILSTIDEYEESFTEIVDDMYEEYELVSEAASDEVVKEVIDRFPLLSHYIGGGSFKGFNARELPAVIAGELKSYMHTYIVRRLMWCLGLVVLFGTLGILTLDKHRPSGGGRGMHGRRQPAGVRSTINSRGRHQHVSTRRR